MKAYRISQWVAYVVLGCAAGLVAITAQTSKSSTKIDGILIDEKCSANAQSRVVPGTNPHLEGGILWAYTHTRKCALMPDCQKSGYGLATHDNRFLLFDAASNRKALALLQASNKEDDLEVEVTGEIQGDKIRIDTIKWR